MNTSPRNRSIHSLKNELLSKSQEAALSAIQTYNNPLIRFKSETFIVLMTISWTYLLHAYFREKHVDYRYFEVDARGKKHYDKTKYKSDKFWELEECLKHKDCPLDNDTRNNLKFLLVIRHEIEHQMTRGLDDYLGGRYQACAMNYCHYMRTLFPNRFTLDAHFAYAIQLVQLSPRQSKVGQTEISIPAKLQSAITKFDDLLSDGEQSSERYSYSLIFTRKLANHKNQAETTIEFVDPTSEIAESIEKQYWVQKQTEKPKYRPTAVVTRMGGLGFEWFRMNEHTLLWKSLDAKDPSKGLGVQVEGTWYWYENWLRLVEDHCREKHHASLGS